MRRRNLTARTGSQPTLVDEAIVARAVPVAAPVTDKAAAKAGKGARPIVATTDAGAVQGATLVGKGNLHEGQSKDVEKTTTLQRTANPEKLDVSGFALFVDIQMSATQQRALTQVRNYYYRNR